MHHKKILLLACIISATNSYSQYNKTAEEIQAGKAETVFGDQTKLAIKEDDASWRSKATIQVTNVTDENEAKKYKLKYGSAPEKEVAGNYDKDKKTVLFNVADVVENTVGLFKISYNDTPKGKFQFSVEKEDSALKEKEKEKEEDNAIIIDDPDILPDAYKYVVSNGLLPRSYYDERSNVYRKGQTVQIIIDAQGNFIKGHLPTTAVRSFKYHVILIKRKADKRFSFKLVRPAGGLTDNFNIMNPAPITPSVVANASSAGQPDEKSKELEIWDLGVMGPFEDDFIFSVLRIKLNSAEPPYDLISQEVKVARLYHVSIQAGMIGTFLRSPQNITPAILPSGDTTLTADDPKSRGIFTIMAVFYPRGRSFLFPPSGGLFSPERFGIVVGARVDKNQFENFFGGLQFDFARGGSLSFGVHYGRRSVILDNRKFHFGKDIFTGTLENKIKQEWSISPFLGVNVDIRVFNFLFGTNPTTP